jgi:SAM-dependent methyltransferase
MRYNEHFHQRRVGHPRYPVLAHAALIAYSAAFPNAGPETVIDVGSSVGALLAAIQDIEPCKAYGFDYSVKPDDIVFDGEYLTLDLNKDNVEDLALKADLIICQEVLEHVEPENTANALQVLRDLAEPDETLMVFGAAKPGQPGKHHVNCRTRMEWQALLEADGWMEQPFSTTMYSEILNDSEHISSNGCYITNTMCFVRK